MSGRQFEFSAAARLDLLQAWNYLAENASFDVADKVLADIEAAIRKIAEFPGLGHERADLTDRPLLFYLVHSYLIVYRRHKKPLNVVRVLHSARDIKRLLAP